MMSPLRPGMEMNSASYSGAENGMSAVGDALFRHQLHHLLGEREHVFIFIS